MNINSKFILSLTNFFFILLIFFSLIVIIFGLFKIFTTNDVYGSEDRIFFFYVINILFGIASTSFFILGLKKFSLNLKINLSILLLTSIILLYILEIFIEFFVNDLNNLRKINEYKKFDLEYDTRTKIEVIEELNDSGKKTYPNLSAFFFMNNDGFSYENSRILPLGSISNSFTIFDNEAGFFPVIELDKYGFHNPIGAYDNNQIDIMLIGDSFAAGESVNSKDSIASNLREFGLNVINLGKSGNGPLLELATLYEYGRYLKPNVVLWLYYENDLNDLNAELNSKLLKKYLNEKNFSQNLIFKQDVIDEILIKFSKNKNKIRKYKENKTFKIFRFVNLREKIINSYVNFFYNSTEHKETEFVDLETFNKILSNAKEFVESWDGELYFIYLSNLYFPEYKEHDYKKDVINIAKQTNLEIIDVHLEVFQNHPDPLSLFPLRQNKHYNSEGYNLISKKIYEKLN